MYCNKCGNEFPEGSIFCNKCGSKTTTNLYIDTVVKLKILNKRYIIFGLIGVFIVGTIISMVIILNNPIDMFKDAINKNNYVEVSKIYNEKIKGNESNETKATNFLKADIDSIKKNFSENKIEYDVATSKLNTIDKTGLLSSEVLSATNKINELNDSRTAYKVGKEFLDSKNYREGLSELKKVIKEDESYNNAQELINGSIKDYKTEVLSEAETSANKSDYDDAITLLNEALTMIPNDSDISAKNAIYEKQNEEKIAAERKKKMDELEKNQEVSVQNISISKDWIDDYYLSIVVKNNSNKVVKKYIVGWLGYDKNNYPVKTGWLSPDFLQEGNAEANIQPTQTFGADNGWELTGGFDKTMEAVKFLACIKEVEYYDGTKWDNPYYQYWLEEFKEKPLH